MALKLFSAGNLLESVNRDVAKVLTIERKKGPVKDYDNTEFMNPLWSIGTDSNKEGWFKIENIKLTSGIIDPASNTGKDGKRKLHEGNRLQLTTSLSESGAFGKALHLLNPHFRNLVEQMANNKIIDLEGKRIHDLFQYTLSKKNEKSPGAVIDDPVLRFHVDFKPFPVKHPKAFLRNQPKTQFFDARATYQDENGVTRYKPAMVNVNGVDVPVDANNVHLFVTKGSTIVEGIIIANTVPVSSSWVSLPLTAHKIVLMPAEAEGFIDDGYNSGATVQTTSTQTVSAKPAEPAAIPTVVPTVVPTKPAEPVVVPTVVTTVVPTPTTPAPTTNSSSLENLLANL